MQTLIGSDTADSRFTVTYFCRSVAATIGALTAKAGGVEALIFTGGIGEHSPEVRVGVCAALAFLGIRLASEANNGNRQSINDAECMPVLRIKVDEESEIAALTKAALNAGNIES